MITGRSDGFEPYDKVYLVAGQYSTWAGPQPYFYFSYPPSLYDNVDYSFENDGEDIDIVFSRNGDGSYLEVSCHPLPEGVEDLKAYAESLEEQEIAALYNGLEANFKDARDDYGLCRFRVHGFSEQGGGLKCWVMCHVDSNYVMRMVLRYPVGTDDEDKKIKTFYMKQINYKCGFGIPTKAPTFGSMVQ